MKNLLIIILLILPVICFGQTPGNFAHPHEDPNKIILENLKEMEDLYISKLNKTEKRQALRLMNETIHLIKQRNEKSFVNPLILSNETIVMLINEMKSISGADEKTNLLLTFVPHGMMLSSQVKEILELYNFDSHKIEMIKSIYKFVYDKQNMFMVLSSFSSFDKEELLEYFRNN